jgi:hypothetical protein
MYKLLPLGIIVVLGFLPLAHATNESDYKYGFKLGEDGYRNCSKYNSCTTEENLLTFACDPSQANVINLTHQPTYVAGNQTACNDGNFHGWIHECLKDGGGALCVYQPGHIIIAGRTGPGHCYNTTKEGETCESGNFIPTHRSG